MRKAVPKIQTDDPDLNRVQDNILAALNGALRDLDAVLSLDPGTVALSNYGATQNGAADDLPALRRFLSEIGTDPATLLVTGPCRVSAPLTIPSTVRVRFEGAGAFSGSTVTYTAWTLPAGTVGTTQIANDGVATAKVADGAITDAKLAAMEAWTEPTLTGATNTGAPYTNTRYKKVRSVVYVQVAWDRSVGDGSTIFTMPAGYRPNGKVTCAGHNGVLAVDASGNVITFFQSVNPLVATISFPADQ